MRSMPSGAASSTISLILVQPYSFIKPMAASALPPVASMGSTIRISRSATSLGILQKYFTGSSVSSFRYRPMWPTRAPGTIRSTPSTSPRPARRMGTTANFLPLRVGAVVLQMGVSTSRSVRGRSRVAS